MIEVGCDTCQEVIENVATITAAREEAEYHLRKCDGPCPLAIAGRVIETVTVLQADAPAPSPGRQIGRE